MAYHSTGSIAPVYTGGSTSPSYIRNGSTTPYITAGGSSTPKVNVMAGGIGGSTTPAAYKTYDKNGSLTPSSSLGRLTIEPYNGTGISIELYNEKYDSKYSNNTKEVLLELTKKYYSSKTQQEKDKILDTLSKVRISTDSGIGYAIERTGKIIDKLDYALNEFTMVMLSTGMPIPPEIAAESKVSAAEEIGALESSNVIKGTVKTQWYKPDGSINYPPNNGAIPGTEVTITLQKGQTLGRYGNITSKSDYVTAHGVSPSSLSLPPTTDSSIYIEYVVVKPIPNTVQSTVAPWGGDVGGGLQYKLPMPIEQLLKEGYIIKK